MPLIKNVSTNTFDVTAIQKGACIRAKRSDYSDFRNGFVTEVTTGTLTVLYANDSGTGANYYTIAADEVAAGLWQIYWTSDFATVNTEGVTPSA